MAPALPKAPIVAMAAVLVVLALLLAFMATGAAPTQPAQQLVVDECSHTEFRRECYLTIGNEEYGGTAQELSHCYEVARASALRFPAAVEPWCRVPGAPARLW